ncbi:MAG TPA: sigma-70 family RNA polymerase sigma factor [Longimicrobium sp.]
MAEPDVAGAEVEQFRPLLFSLAYRMLGSVADAEDAVQETFLRWHRAEQEEVRSPKDWLCAVVTRLCIDHLRSARVRREEYVGPWLPEPLVQPLDEDPLEAAVLAESLSTAFLLMLERLTAMERAVFLLREVFSFEYEEVARIVGRSEGACRQLAKRARDKVAAGEPRFTASEEDAQRMALRFMEVCARGDVDEIRALLAEDAIAMTDGGGKRRGALNPVYGRDHVARLFAGLAHKWGVPPVDLVRVNGQPGFVMRLWDGPRVMSFAVRDGLITGVYLVGNPDKLTHLPVPPEEDG